jgi:hypothetical protein
MLLAPAEEAELVYTEKGALVQQLIHLHIVQAQPATAVVAEAVEVVADRLQCLVYQMPNPAARLVSMAAAVVGRAVT